MSSYISVYLFIFRFIVRSRGFNIGGSRGLRANSEAARRYLEEKTNISLTSGLPSLKCLYHEECGSSNFYVKVRSLSSHAGAKSSDEDDDDLEDGFSELESPESNKTQEHGEKESDDELVSEPELHESDDDDIGEGQASHNELELSDTESGVSEKQLGRRRGTSLLFKAVMDAPGLSVHSALDKWVEEGKDLTRGEIALAMLNLRQRRMYGRALQVSDLVF